MGIKDGYTFEDVYEDYLAWFRERAVASAQPKDKEVILEYQLGREDTYESEDLIFNRIYYFIPLPPSESKSRRLEIFAITESNVIQQATSKYDGATDDRPIITTVEYTGHAFSN